MAGIGAMASGASAAGAALVLMFLFFLTVERLILLLAQERIFGDSFKRLNR